MGSAYRSCMLTAVVFVLSATSSAFCQSLSGLKVGDDLSTTTSLNADPNDTTNMGPFSVNKWTLPDGNSLSVTAKVKTQKIVFIECDWNGSDSGTFSDFPDFYFGRTSLNEIRRQALMAFEKRAPSMMSICAFAAAPHEIPDTPSMKLFPACSAKLDRATPSVLATACDKRCAFPQTSRTVLVERAQTQDGILGLARSRASLRISASSVLRPSTRSRSRTAFQAHVLEPLPPHRRRLERPWCLLPALDW